MPTCAGSLLAASIDTTQASSLRSIALRACCVRCAVAFVLDRAACLFVILKGRLRGPGAQKVPNTGILPPGLHLFTLRAETEYVQSKFGPLLLGVVGVSGFREIVDHDAAVTTQPHTTWT